MKHVVMFLRWYGQDASVILAVVLFLAGCSGGSSGGGTADGSLGIEKSKYYTLKKASKNPAEFKKALQRKKIEKLKEKGFTVEIKTQGKVTKSVR
jgi:hypothetical protein